MFKTLNNISNFNLFLYQAPECPLRKRPKRDTKVNESSFDDGHPATIEVYSGLYVNENAEIVEGTDDSVYAEKVTRASSPISIKKKTTKLPLFTESLLFLSNSNQMMHCVYRKKVLPLLFQ